MSNNRFYCIDKNKKALYYKSNVPFLVKKGDIGLLSDGSSAIFEVILHYKKVDRLSVIHFGYCRELLKEWAGQGYISHDLNEVFNKS